MTGRHIDFKNHCIVVCGWYVEAHNDPNIINNMNPRTHEWITLGPTGNIQWTQKVFCLNLEIFLKWRKIIPIIVSDRIIKILEDLSKKSIRDNYGKSIDILNSNKEILWLVKRGTGIIIGSGRGRVGKPPHWTFSRITRRSYGKIYTGTSSGGKQIDWIPEGIVGRY